MFFQEVQPSCDSDHNNLPELLRNRGTVCLVFTIFLSDTQNVVNVWSALVLHNEMETPLEIKLKSPKTDKEKQENLPSVKLPHLCLHVGTQLSPFT